MNWKPSVSCNKKERGMLKGHPLSSILSKHSITTEKSYRNLNKTQNRKGIDTNNKTVVVESTSILCTLYLIKVPTVNSFLYFTSIYVGY